MDKRWQISVLVVSMVFSITSWALNEGTHLNPRGQSKVNKALAKGYLQSGAEEMQKQLTQVNIGSRRAGNCTMNIGTSPGSGKDSKETIVTAKEIINVCK